MRIRLRGEASTILYPSMYPSLSRILASSTLRVDVGMSTCTCFARSALRTRVRKSAIGSVMFSLSPGRLGDPGQGALEGQFPEAQAAEPELAVNGARPAALG